MKIGAIQAQINNKSAVENKSSSKAGGADFSFSSALVEVGKSLSGFIPKINNNAKVYQADIKKIKSVSEELSEELPTLEDEAEEILGRIQALMEQYRNS